MTTFLKMHGLGNDFVIFDARTFPLGSGQEDLRGDTDSGTNKDLKRQQHRNPLTVLRRHYAPCWEACWHQMQQ